MGEWEKEDIRTMINRTNKISTYKFTKKIKPLGGEMALIMWLKEL